MNRVSQFLVLLVLVTSASSNSQSTRSAAPEQTHFSAEGKSVQRPVAVPEDLRSILYRDEAVAKAISATEPALAGFPRFWFLASVVHLGSAQEEDMVLVGRGPLLGANVTQFWVFRHIGGKCQEVLNEHAHDLNLLPATGKGLREIELLSATGVSAHTVRLRFDSDRYKVYRDEWKPTQ